MTYTFQRRSFAIGVPRSSAIGVPRSLAIGVLRSLAIVVIIVALSLPLPAEGQEIEWTWTDASGSSRTRTELEEILRLHEEWRESDGKGGRQADLTGANLIGADLIGADLIGADLTGANLTGANLTGANLTGAILTGSALKEAILTGSALDDADLRRAILSGSALDYADLTGANLTEADLTNAYLAGADLTRAILSGSALDYADLREVILSGSALDDAYLTGANLIDADLTGANLTEAILDNAILSRVDLTGANLAHADLADGDLTGANLTRAILADGDLTGANLTGANLADADLTDGDLTGANLTGANLTRADLQATIFQPDSVPESRDVVTAENLQFLRYENAPGALVQLRNVFKNSGFLDQERKITYALRRRQAELLWEECDLASLLDCGAYAFNRVFFDITSHYGMNPSRPLLLALAGWFLCTLIYSLFIHFPGASGVYVVKTRTHSGREHTRRLQIRRRAIPPEQRWRRTWKYPLHVFLREWRLARAAMFFSLMSTLNLGFRDFNLGRWLRMLTKREYDMKAIGWVRTVAGFQSLISVYLIALWVLTYFGRPFG